MLNVHYGKQVVFLIDEYDVPLAKASESGYYAEMIIGYGIAFYEKECMLKNGNV